MKETFHKKCIGENCQYEWEAIVEHPKSCPRCHKRQDKKKEA